MTALDGSFGDIASFVLEKTGIVFERDKEYLLDSRLTPVLKKNSLSSFTELASAIRRGNSNIQNAVIEALTTNETLFFRDNAPFEVLRTRIIPSILKHKNDRRLSIWCGAASTGQEPYSVMITLREMDELRGWDINFLATDISEEVLERAKSGIYSHLEVSRGLSPEHLAKYFTRKGIKWQIEKSLVDSVRFSKLNLIGDWSVIPRCDIVFMRNVLIYFSPETKGEIFKKIESKLHPHGFVMLGAAETTIGVTDRFQRLKDSKSGCYHLNEYKVE